MSDETKLVAEPREGTGTALARNMRREGLIPGIIYDSKTNTECIQLNRHDFEMLLKQHKSEHLIIDLEIGKGKSKKTLLKDVQHHPVSGDVLHVDFMEISMTDKMTFRIGVELKGEAVGVTKDGGIMEHMVREIDVECLPTDLVETVVLDVSALEVGDSLLIKDIVIDSKLTIITSEDVAVVAVAAPRVEEEPEEEEGIEGEEGAEGEEGDAADGDKADGDKADGDKADGDKSKGDS
jgi:large subunit ribosomal protein L25